MHGSPVVLINRTNRILEFVADGQHHQLTPGDNYGFNEAQAVYAKRQNPLMGSEDYHTLASQYLVAVKGTTDPVTPITDDELNAIERFDRATMPGAQVVQIVPIRHRPLGRIVGIAGAESQAIGG